MGDQNDDYNDQMFELDDQRHQGNESMSSPSDIGSSLSNFGIDRDNPEDNQRYIQQNQDLHAIIQGIGIAENKSDSTSEHKDSGLATSISKTRNTAFTPEIIEYLKESISDVTSEVNETIEPQAGPSSGVRYGYDPKYDESEKLAESLQELDVSAFDLALERGYHDQAKLYYDDASAKGVQVQTKFIKKLNQIVGEDRQREIAMNQDPSLLEEDFWSQKYCLQRVFMLKKDFEEYLENIEKNNHKKVLNKLNSKDILNEREKQIFKNIKTKEKRNDLKLKSEVRKIILDFIKILEELEEQVKHHTKHPEKYRESDKKKHDD